MKTKKIACAVALSAVLCTSAAFAAPYAVAATLRPDIQVSVDGGMRTFYNASGQEVHPISYNYTTYLPVRAIGELMGKNVNWDAATQTVSIGGTRVTPNTQGTPDYSAVAQPIDFSLRADYTVVIDGQQRTFYDANGQVCYPAEYNGSIYLPIRAIGQMMGKDVSWNETTQTVSLTGGKNNTSGSTVTDFDTANSGAVTLPTNPPVVTPPVVTPPVTTPPATTNGVSLERAKQIALEHAGVSASGVQFVKARKDFDDGRTVYDIEFVITSSGGYKEYDYEIDANSGVIISYDYDVEGYVPPVTGGSSNTNTGDIGAERAKQIALSRVPGATNANIFKFKKDFDDGRLEYEGEIVYNYKKYEFTIDAATGNITDWELDD